MQDGLVLMYAKDGVIYPIVLTQEQNELLQFVGKLFAPIKYVEDLPLGPAINVAEVVKKRGNVSEVR